MIIAGNAKPFASPLSKNEKKDRSAAPELPGVGMNEIAAFKIKQTCATISHSEKPFTPSTSNPKNFKVKYAIETFAACSAKLQSTKTINASGRDATILRHFEFWITVFIKP